MTQVVLNVSAARRVGPANQRDFFDQRFGTMGSRRMRAFGKTEGGFAPVARTADLVVTEAAGQVIVYDTASHHIHHLNRVVATIWRRCDGRTSMGDLARRSASALGEPVDEAIVRAALTKLDAVSLLAGPVPAALRLESSSRRTLLKRLATASAVPVIASMSAPTAAMAQSTTQCINEGGAVTGTQCFSGFICCSNICETRPGEPKLCRDESLAG